MMKRLSSRSSLAAIIVLVTALGGAGLALFLNHESTRDVAQWGEKLSLVASARAREVNGWMQNQYKELGIIADNASVQIYVGQLTSDAAENGAQADYLRVMLAANAERLGFDAKSGNADGGLAIVDMNGKTLVATEHMPAIDGTLAEHVAAAPKATASLIDIEQMADKTVRMGFIIPIYSVQGNRDAASQIGALVGVRPVNESFYTMLAPSNEIGRTFEVALLRKEGDSVRYLSPLQNGAELLATSAPANDDNAAGFVVLHPGEFTASNDYRGQQVMVTSRIIDGTPWVLTAKIDQAEALANAKRSRAALTVSFIALLSTLIASVVAIWRHMVARERARRAKTLDQLVGSIVSLIDSRDPHASERSARVARIAGGVARTLHCDKLAIDTTETAARLMHIGHVDVPIEWLTRAAPLNKEERAVIKSSFEKSADILANIDFEGPVAETLRQAQEHVDGSGPLGLKGEAILLSARIVAVSDVLVGMQSARTYRQPMSLEQALSELKQKSDKHFDRRVVDALIAYANSDDGRALFASQPHTLTA